MVRLSKIMRRKLITVHQDATLREARRLLHDFRIRHLLVTDRKRLVGIVTDRDLRTAATSSKSPLSASERAEFMDAITVKEVMRRRLITGSPDTTVGEAAKVMVSEKIGCLPIVDDGSVLVGIVTESDLLEALVELLAAETAAGARMARRPAARRPVRARRRTPRAGGGASRDG
jgi:acetoin utilization protein AcuB